MGKYFGTDGFRGEANVTLTAEHAYRIGRFLGGAFGGRCRAVIGKDTRRSGYMLEYALAAGLSASGADAYLMHVTTTPSVSYITAKDGFDIGVMISASHNPYYDNGIKLINSKGEKIDEDFISRIEEYIDGKADELPLARREDIGRTVDYIHGRDEYADYLISLGGDFSGRRIALDCANGSAWQLAGRVFSALGAEVLVINNSPDGQNINNGCGSTHIEGLCKFVRENGCDAGFAYDGDADRCIAVDENGSVIDGDMIMYISAAYMKKKGELEKNTLVTTVMSNIGLYKALDEAGIAYEKTAVGDKYVYECMSENGYSIGGEQSGHIIYSRYASTGDGILTSIMLTNIMAESGAGLCELSSPVTIYPQLLVNIPVKDKDAALSDAGVIAATERASKALGSDGRILVRPSGTEMLIRVMAEAKTEELCRRYVDDIASALSAHKL